MNIIHIVFWIIIILSGLYLLFSVLSNVVEGFNTELDTREKDLKNIVDNFQNLNERMKKLTNELSLVDRKMCDSKDLYIGIEFPENIQTL